MTSKYFALLSLLLLSTALWASDLGKYEKRVVKLSKKAWPKSKLAFSLDTTASDLQVWSVENESEKVGYLFVTKVIGKTDPIILGGAVSDSGILLSFKVFKTKSKRDALMMSPYWQKQFVKRELHKVDAVSSASNSSRKVVGAVERVVRLVIE